MESGGSTLFKFLWALFISFSVFSQSPESEKTIEVQAPKKIQAAGILQRIDVLKTKNYSEVIASLDDLENQVMRFVEQENLQCVSEVDVVEKDDEGNEFITKRKLNHKERKVCFKKVVEFRMQYVEKFYELRVVLLSKLHKSQLKDLKDQNELNKSELEKILTKYN